MVMEVVDPSLKRNSFKLRKTVTGLKNLFFFFLAVKRIYIECDICVSLIQCQGADRD